jgi:hypothetical protein
MTAIVEGLIFIAIGVIIVVLAINAVRIISGDNNADQG